MTSSLQETKEIKKYKKQAAGDFHSHRKNLILNYDNLIENGKKAKSKHGREVRGGGGGGCQLKEGAGRVAAAWI